MNQPANQLVNDTLLDAEETTGVSLDPSDYRSVRIHSVRDEYSAAYELYSYLDSITGKDRTTTLRSCRTFAWFVRDIETGLVHVASNSCKLRWCPVCAKAKSYLIQQNVMKFAVEQRNLRMLTLTLRHTSADLTNQIDFLYSCFRTLRKMRTFKKLVTGGIWFFQITYDKNTGYWHPHIHCLITGFYLPKDWLIKAWSRVTKGSFICDIKLVREHEQVAKYVARYCSRPIDLKEFPLELRVVIFNSFHARRLNGTWGKAKVVSLSPQRYLQKERYVKLGTWSTVYHNRKWNPKAMMIFRCWLEKTVLLDDVTMIETDRFIDDTECLYHLDDLRKLIVQPEFW